MVSPAAVADRRRQRPSLPRGGTRPWERRARGGGSKQATSDRSAALWFRLRKRMEAWRQAGATGEVLRWLSIKLDSGTAAPIPSRGQLLRPDGRRGALPRQGSHQMSGNWSVEEDHGRQVRVQGLSGAEGRQFRRGGTTEVPPCSRPAASEPVGSDRSRETFCMSTCLSASQGQRQGAAAPTCSISVAPRRPHGSEGVVRVLLVSTCACGLSLDADQPPVAVTVGL
eukprot:SAG31_NODE_614_length_13525_cov_4.312230_11_plen_226_part_00